MAVNKIVVGDTVLIDLTSDNVKPEDVASGKKFHDRTGVQKVGTLNNAVANLGRSLVFSKKSSKTFCVVKDLDVEPARTVNFSKEVTK